MVKRVVDVVLASVGVLFLWPILLLISVWIKVDSRGPVFYRGVRVGRSGRPFRIFKFRTMIADAESCGASSTPVDDPRITAVGRFLREHKLDEVPQLLNVIAGTMSLVGPRPQTAWMVALYSEEERRLLELRPGITDYSSLKFRNEGEILRGSQDPDRDYIVKIHPEKMRLSLHYLDNHSVWLDLTILFRTVATLLGDSPTISANVVVGRRAEQ